MAEPASTVSAPTEMVAMDEDEDMPGIYDFIAAAPSNTLAGSAPVPWIPAPLYSDEDFVASPVPPILLQKLPNHAAHSAQLGLGVTHSWMALWWQCLEWLWH